MKSGATKLTSAHLDAITRKLLSRDEYTAYTVSMFNLIMNIDAMKKTFIEPALNAVDEMMKKDAEADGTLNMDDLKELEEMRAECLAQMEERLAPILAMAHKVRDLALQEVVERIYGPLPS